MKVINTYIVTVEAISKHSDWYVGNDQRKGWAELYECEGGEWYARFAGSISKLDAETIPDVLAHTKPA
jgi:hypothetical protein